MGAQIGYTNRGRVFFSFLSPYMGRCVTVWCMGRAFPITAEDRMVDTKDRDHLLHELAEGG